MGLTHTELFSGMVKKILDEDLQEVWEQNDVMYDAILLLQILRELKKEGPEEKGKPIRGFGGSDAPF